jgi:hypothetical protein
MCFKNHYVEMLLIYGQVKIFFICLWINLSKLVLVPDLSTKDNNQK